MNAYNDSLGNEAGTAVNRFMERLVGLTPKSRKALEDDLKLNFWEESGKGKNKTVRLKPIEDIIKMLRDKLRGMKNEKIETLLLHHGFAEEGAKAVSNFVSQDIDYSEFKKQIESSTGLQKKLEIQSQGVGAAFDRMKNSTISLVTGIDSVNHAITHLLDSINDGIKFLNTGKIGEYLKNDVEEFGQSFKSLKDKINEILEPKSMRPSSPHGNISPNDMPPIPQAPNGKISIEIKSQNPLRVTSMSASSGEIEVKNIRSGMHFT